MPEPDYTLRQNDSGEAITAVLEDSAGDAVNLTGAAVVFQLAPIGGGALVVQADAAIIDAAAGEVSYTWQGADSATPGWYLASWQVTFSGGEVQTFPNGGYTLVQITGELGLLPPVGTPTGALLRAYVQDDDPGNVGAGAIWVNTTPLGIGAPDDVLPTLIRNATNDGWISQGLAYYVDGAAKSFVTVGDGGVVAELLVGEPGVGLALTADEAVLRHGGTYFWIQPGINLAYIHLEDGVRFWFNNPLNADTWGISDPSGAEMFGSIPEPDDSEFADFSSLRLQWFDNTTGSPALRFKQKDAGGTITTGKSAGLTDDGTSFKGVTKPNLPTSPTATQIAAVLSGLGLVNLT